MTIEQSQSADARPVQSVSLVMAVCNNPDEVRFTLSQVARCRIPAGLDVELLVVDNNSRDATPEMVRALLRDFPIPGRLVQETRQGLAFARNAGVDASSGEIIVHLDQDAFPAEDFLEQLKGEFERHQRPIVIGGRVELWDKSHKPITIKTTLVEETLGRRADPVGFIHGCNLNYDRAVYDLLGGFDGRFGVGAPLLASDDLDFYYRAARAGIPLVYSPKPLMFHNHGRSTDAQVRRLMKAYEISVGAFYLKHLAARHPMAPRHLYWNLRASLRTLIVRRAGDPPRRETGLRLWHYLLGAWRYVRARRPTAR